MVPFRVLSPFLRPLSRCLFYIFSSATVQALRVAGHDAGIFRGSGQSEDGHAHVAQRVGRSAHQPDGQLQQRLRIAAQLKSRPNQTRSGIKGDRFIS